MLLVFFFSFFFLKKNGGGPSSARKRRKKKRRNRKDKSAKGDQDHSQDRPDVAPGVAEMIKSAAASAAVPTLPSPLSSSYTKPAAITARAANGLPYYTIKTASSTRVVIFDFDHTIATDQIDEEILENRASVCHGKPLGNRDRVEMLNDLLGELKASGVLCTEHCIPPAFRQLSRGS